MPLSLVVVGAILANWIVMGQAVIVLNAALVVCFVVWARQSWGEAPAALRWGYMGAIVVQAAHLGEEYWSGFYRSYPALFGYEWTARRFLVFNIAWLTVFGLGFVGLCRNARWSYLVALFLGLGGGVLNGIGHAALAARSGGYFPGLYTAPLCLAIGVLLLTALRGARVHAVPPN